MKILVQRVKKASVKVEQKISGHIGKGLLVFLGIHRDDIPEQTRWLVNKLINLRIFSDEQDKLNLTVKDIQGEILVVSQFTLYGNCQEGRRPDFTQAAPSSVADPIYHKFVEEIKQELNHVQTGIFGAKMEVALINDGPVTVLIEAK